MHQLSIRQMGKTVFNSAFLLAAFICGITSPKAQTTDASCEAVIDSISQLRKQPWVLLRGQVTQGVHPEGYTAMISLLLDGRRQLRVLDGRRFSSNKMIFDQAELDQVTGAMELTPDSSCVRILPVDPPAADTLRADTLRADIEPSSAIEYTYSTKVARSEAYFRIWISPSLGLPLRVLVNGPQLAYGRSLSRPGKPPQAVLKTNGLRYTEIFEYEYGEGLVRAAERLGK
jgi:hypothetical protein